jgi:hypothetical protein
MDNWPNWIIAVMGILAVVAALVIGALAWLLTHPLD